MGFTDAKPGDSQVHVRQEGFKEPVEHPCPTCGQDCKTPGGLGNHIKSKHSLDTKILFKNDFIEVYATLPRIRDAIYDKKLNLWLSNEGVTIPSGYKIYSIAENSENIVTKSKAGEQRQQNTVFKIRLIKEDKTI